MGVNGGGVLGTDDARAQRRAEPRMWVAIAAVGCALAVFGLFLISGDAQAGGEGDDGSPVTGIVLSLLVVLAGYALMHLLREAPAASAGVTAVILGLPALALFLTLDVDDVPPFSIELFLGLPALVWGVSYLVGPGRGRPVLAGFALVFAWLFVLQVIEDPFASGTFDQIVEPGIIEDEFGDPGFDEDFGSGEFDEDFDEGFDRGELDEDFDEGGFDGGGSDAPDPTTVGWLSVLFGAGYLALTRRFDKRHLAGTATPFVVAGHIALITGIVALADDLQASGVGIALVIAGVIVARLGAVGGRRLTTIIGAVEIGLGALIVLGDAMEESTPTSFGTALFVLGAAIAALAQVLHVSTREPTQTSPGPSSFPGWAQGRLRVATTSQRGTPGPWGGPPAGGAPGPWSGPPQGPWSGSPQAPWSGPPEGGAAGPWAGPPAYGRPPGASGPPDADPRFAPPPPPPPPPPAPDPPARQAEGPTPPD